MKTNKNTPRRGPSKQNLGRTPVVELTRADLKALLDSPIVQAFERAKGPRLMPLSRIIEGRLGIKQPSEKRKIIRRDWAPPLDRDPLGSFSSRLP